MPSERIEEQLAANRRDCAAIDQMVALLSHDAAPTHLEHVNEYHGYVAGLIDAGYADHEAVDRCAHYMRERMRQDDPDTALAHLEREKGLLNADVTDFRHDDLVDAAYDRARRQYA